MGASKRRERVVESLLGQLATAQGELRGARADAEIAARTKDAALAEADELREVVEAWGIQDRFARRPSMFHTTTFEVVSPGPDPERQAWLRKRWHIPGNLNASLTRDLCEAMGRGLITASIVEELTGWRFVGVEPEPDPTDLLLSHPWENGPLDRGACEDCGITAEAFDLDPFRCPYKKETADG